VIVTNDAFVEFSRMCNRQTRAALYH